MKWNEMKQGIYTPPISATNINKRYKLLMSERLSYKNAEKELIVKNIIISNNNNRKMIKLTEIVDLIKCQL